MIDVRFHSMLLNPGGYAEAGRRVGFTLAQQPDINVQFIPIRGTVVDNLVQEQYTKLQGRPIPTNKEAVNITLMIPSYLKRMRGINVIYTMFEAGTIPPKFANECNQADEVWCPTHWNAEAFRKGGIIKPIHVFPLGIDLSLYDRREKLFQIPKEQFTFLCVANHDERKGLNVMIPAFIKEFRNEKNVKLIIKSSYRARYGISAQNKIMDDLKKYAQSAKGSLNQIELITRPLSTVEMPMLYNSCDCFVLPTFGEGMCALPGSPIKTIKGYRNIEDIRIGEQIINRKGEIDIVNELMERNVKEEIYNILTHRINLDMNLTKEHPVWGIRDARCKLKKKRPNSCMPRYCKNICKQRYCNERKPQLEWIQVKDLTENSVLTYPRYKELLNEKRIDMLEYTEFYQEKNEEFILVKKDKKIPRYIDFDEKLGTILGYYLAEGYINEKTNTVSFCFNSKEKETYVLELIRFLSEVFNPYNTYQKPIWRESQDNNWGVLDFYNKSVVLLLKELGGSMSHSKKILEDIKLLPSNIIKSILISYIKSDGHIKKNGIEGRTVSKDLALDIFDLFARLDICPSLSYFPNNKGFSKGNIYSISAVGHKCYDIFGKQFNFKKFKKDNNKAWMDKEFVYIPVKKITKEEYEGKVYNFEVENDNSYIINGVVVHNCLPALEALATKTPIIITKFGAHMDFLDDSNSYLIECTERQVSSLSRISSYYGGQKWGVPLEESLRAQMRHVYENYSEAQNKVRKGYEDVQRFDIHNTIVPLYNRVQQIYGKPIEVQTQIKQQPIINKASISTAPKQQPVVKTVPKKTVINEPKKPIVSKSKYKLMSV